MASGAVTGHIVTWTRWPLRVLSGACLILLFAVLPMGMLAFFADPRALIQAAGLIALLCGLHWATFVRTRRTFAAAAALTLTGVAVFGIVPPVMDRVRFAQQRPVLDRAVAAAARGGQQACRTVTRGCIVDRDTPLRVAVRWNGLTDNWRGVCYDPSGLIAKARQCSRDHRCTPEELAATSLFRGTMVHASPIKDGWYFCAAS
jgi:hypothetical protein